MIYIHLRPVLVFSHIFEFDKVEFGAVKFFKFMFGTTETVFLYDCEL